MNDIAILWDFDNTLGYRDGMWTSCLHELLIEQGITHITKELISPFMQNGFPWHRYEIAHQDLFNGKLWWEFMEHKLLTILTQLKLEPELSKHISIKFKFKYTDIQYWHLFDDSLYALKKANELGYSNYILSNHTPELITIVDGLGITKCIKKVFSSGIIGYEKPHYKIFQFALKNIPNNIKKIMIGDNYIADIVGAKSNGIQGILVRSENKYNHEFYSKDFKNVLELVQQI
jgi:putative hydrolase of the HAD superfamily